jgi:hypothetical protein
VNDASPPGYNKFRAYRARKKASGLREVRLWLPDVGSPAFMKDARRQAALLDHSEDELQASATMRQLSTESWDSAD